ncbi:MAG: hypothetical protein JWR68_1780 [Polaromonas sp.]|nr:hypothetical protein [Polaromonas sp.]
MDKYSGPDDIYQVLVEESEENWLLGLLAFAVVEEQRIEWAKHHTKISGLIPNAKDIQSWYESQPQSMLVKARAEAESVLKNYGAQAAEAFDDSYRKEIAQGIVVAEIQKLGRWLPQFGMNVAGGVVSSIVFSAILILLAFFILKGPSTNDFAAGLKQQTEIHSGQNGSNK